MITVKKILTIYLLCFGVLVNAQTTKKVAFLGNSYIFTNNLPGLIDSLAAHQGDDIVYQQATPGGYTFSGHTTNAASLSVIAADTWDYVVLQEQSQLPSFPYAQVITDVYPKANILCDSIRAANACAIPMFFNTWGRLNGDPQWDSINTFEKMNQRLFNAYHHMANVNSGMLSPVGLAFNAIYNDPNAIVTHAQLYSGDGSHPSDYGSYLAACVFNDLIFSTQSIYNSFLPNGMTQLEAYYLQSVADQVVYAASSPIFVFTHPFAEFDFTSTGASFEFNNLSQHAFEYTWDFGDNNTSSLENPTHIYAQNGNFQVKLTAEYCGRQSTYEQTVSITGLGLNELNVEVAIFPNPFQHKFYVHSSPNSSIEIVNIAGKVIFHMDNCQAKQIIDLSDYAAGIYLLKVNNGEEQVVKKLLKE